MEGGKNGGIRIHGLYHVHQIGSTGYDALHGLTRGYAWMPSHCYSLRKNRKQGVSTGPRVVLPPPFFLELCFEACRGEGVIGMPVEGGIYQVGDLRITVIAVGQYCDRRAVVSRINDTDRLSICPIEIWRVEYGAGQLLSVDERVSKQILRGAGSWLVSIDCLVAQHDGELFLSEIGEWNGERFFRQ